MSKQNRTPQSGGNKVTNTNQPVMRAVQSSATTQGRPSTQPNNSMNSHPQQQIRHRLSDRILRWPGCAIVVLAVLLGHSGVMRPALAQDIVATSDVLPAREVSPSGQPSTSGAIYQQDVDQQRRLQQLTTLYQGLVEDYAAKYREFTLNRSQWQTVQTLRSLEEAVVATTAVLVARDRTMTTYFEILLETLRSTPGIELNLKAHGEAMLTTRIEWLNQHEQTSVASIDRAAVNDRSDEYTKEAQAMTTDVERSLSLIRLGKLQTTLDRANGLYQRILERNQENPGTAVQQVRRERAYAQVEQLRADIQTDLTAFRDILQAQSDNNRQSDQNASSVQSLEKPYAKLARYLSFLDELAKDSW